jgi:nucleolin
MVLSNSKLKRKKREEAVLNPPPDSSATPSVANDVKVETPALASAKKKKKKPKSIAVSGDAEEVAAGNGSEVPERDAVEREEVVQQPKKKKSKAAPVLEEAVAAVEDAGVSTDNGAAPVQDGEPKAKIRKKPRWEVDENGKRVKPQRAGGETEGEGHPNGAKAAASPPKGAESGDVQNGAASVPDAANDGDRLHQGDEPWLQSKRKEKKKKKKQTDKWGKKIEEAEAVAVENEEAPQVASSTEEKVDPKKVMVGGMPYYVSEDDIHEYFQECGTIAELDCMTFPDTGKFKGIAFITFRTEEAAKRALAMDGADM